MLKKLIGLALLAMTATGVMAEGNLRIEAIAVSPDAVLTKETATEELTYEVPPWLKDENQRKRWLWVLSPKGTDGEWRKFSFSPPSNRMTATASEIIGCTSAPISRSGRAGCCSHGTA